MAPLVPYRSNFSPLTSPPICGPNDLLAEHLPIHGPSLVVLELPTLHSSIEEEVHHQRYVPDYFKSFAGITSFLECPLVDTPGNALMLFTELDD